MRRDPHDRPLDDRLLAGCVLEPGGVRAQWLEGLAGDGDHAAITKAIESLEHAGLVTFDGTSIRASDQGLARFDGSGWNDAEVAAVHAALARGIDAASYGAGSVHERVAYHLAACGETGLAQRRLVELGRTAMRSCSYDRALTALDRAAELDELGAEDAALRARCARLAGSGRTTELLLAARDAAERDGDAARTLDAMVELLLAGEETHERLRAAATRAAGATPWATYAEALCEYHSSRWTPAVGLGQRALAGAREQADVRLEAACLRLLSNAHAAMGQIEVAVSTMREVIDVADLAGDPQAVVSAYLGLVATLHDELRINEAAEAARNLERFVEMRGVERLRASSFSARSLVELAAGRFDNATRLVRAALGTSSFEGSPTSESAFVALILAEAVVGLRDTQPETERVLDQVGSLLERFGYRGYLDRFEVVRAWHSLRRGDAAPMMTWLRGCGPDVEPGDCAFGALQLARELRLAGERSWTADARRVLAAVPRPEQAPAYARLAWREVDAILGDGETIADAAAAWAEHGAGWDSGMALLVLAQREHDRGDVEAADAAALSALELLSRSGSERDIRIARTLVDRVGRTPVGDGGLLGCDAFAPCSPAVLASLAQAARRLEVGRGEHLLRADDTELGLVVVGEGVAFVVAGDDDRGPVAAVRFAGEAYAPSRGTGHESGGPPASLVAASPVVAWAIPAAALRTACEQDPALVGVLLRIAHATADDLHAFATDLAGAEARTRLARLILRLADRRGRPSLQGGTVVDVVLTADELARMCGTQRQRVSTMLAAWRRDGVLDTWRRRIVVRDAEQLSDAAV